MPTIKRVNLTPAKITSAKPKASPYRLWDARVPGLAVRVLKSGAKTFEVHWSTGSKAIGKFPVLTLTAARLKAQAMLAEAAKHGTPEAARKNRKITLRAFVDDEFRKLTTKNQKSRDPDADRILAAFSEFSDKSLATITAWHVEKWRSARLRAGATPGTCNRDLSALVTALNKACLAHYIDKNPLTGIKPLESHDERVRYLSEAEDGRLRAALAERDSEGRAARARANMWRAERGRELMPFLSEGDYTDLLTPAVLLSLNTGLRRGELTALQWGDINLSENILTVRSTTAKSGKTRHIPLNCEARAVLEQLRRQRPDDARLFPVRDFKSSWRKLMDDADIVNFRWHDMRHDFASKLVMAGVNLNAVRELLGHADLKMTLRYAHLAPSHLADAVARLGSGTRT